MAMVDGKLGIIGEDLNFKKIDRQDLLQVLEGGSGVKVQHKGVDWNFTRKPLKVGQIYTANKQHMPEDEATLARFRIFKVDHPFAKLDYTVDEKLVQEAPQILWRVLKERTLYIARNAHTAQ